MATLVADNLKAAPLPKNTLIVAREDGRLYVVDFSERPQLADPNEIDWDVSTAKIQIAKIQQTRTRLITMEEVELENVTTPPGRQKSLTLFGSLDGKTDTIKVNPTISEYDGGFISAKCRVTAKNFGLQLQGAYILNTVQITYHQNGRR